MNYPFRTALLAYLAGGDAADFRDAMETIRENYPPPAFYGAMNFLGTHDTPRILTLLGAEGTPKPGGACGVPPLPTELARGLAKLVWRECCSTASPALPLSSTAMRPACRALRIR